MATGVTKISMQTEIVLTIKTILTIILSAGSLLWGAYEFVLDKRLADIEDDVHTVEQKIDKVYDHMIGIGQSNAVKRLDEPAKEDTTKGGL